jgi:hypothetical protein
MSTRALYQCSEKRKRKREKARRKQRAFSLSNPNRLFKRDGEENDIAVSFDLNGNFIAVLQPTVSLR